MGVSESLGNLETWCHTGIESEKGCGAGPRACGTGRFAALSTVLLIIFSQPPVATCDLASSSFRLDRREYLEGWDALPHVTTSPWLYRPLLELLSWAICFVRAGLRGRGNFGETADKVTGLSLSSG